MSFSFVKALLKKLIKGVVQTVLHFRKHTDYSFKERVKLEVYYISWSFCYFNFGFSGTQQLLTFVRRENSRSRDSYCNNDEWFKLIFLKIIIFYFCFYLICRHKRPSTKLNIYSIQRWEKIRTMFSLTCTTKKKGP